jgi:hypothetical protein
VGKWLTGLRLLCNEKRKGDLIYKKEKKKKKRKKFIFLKKKEALKSLYIYMCYNKESPLHPRKRQ